MKLPRHVNLSIEHQPHAVEYKTVAEWLNSDRHDFTPADSAAMLATGEVWTITWHPDTPVGSCSVAAATLERVLELANRA